jgi:hypothetical protein
MKNSFIKCGNWPHPVCGINTLELTFGILRLFSPFYDTKCTDLNLSWESMTKFSEHKNFDLIPKYQTTENLSVCWTS